MTISEKWKQTVNDGLTNGQWDEYDQTIKVEIDGYNKRFDSSPGFEDVDWHLIKAMLWTESGGPKSKAWTTRPMQIGNKGDPGYGVLKDGKDGADIIMSDALKYDIKTKSINNPHLNIRAGIAYLFVRMVETQYTSVVDTTDNTEHEYVVQPGDSFYKIAKKVGSTPEELEKLNPGSSNLMPGQTIKYKKAQIQRVIMGWREFSYKNISTRYNVGDPDYAEKLKYVMDLFKKLSR